MSIFGIYMVIAKVYPILVRPRVQSDGLHF